MKRLLLILMPLMVACGRAPATNSVQTKTADSAELKVIYFHSAQRCVTCNAIEKLTKQVVDSLADNRISLQIVDISLPQNEALADKYEVTWSSLILDKGGKIDNLTYLGFSYAKSEPDVFKAELVTIINNALQ